MKKGFQILAALLIPMLLVAGAIGETPKAVPADPTSAPAYWLAKASGNAREGLADLQTRIVLLNMLGRAQAEAGDLAGARQTEAIIQGFIGGGQPDRAVEYELKLLNSLQIEAGMIPEATATLQRRMAMPPEVRKSVHPGFGAAPTTRTTTFTPEFSVDLARLGRIQDADQWIEQQSAVSKTQEHLDVAAVLIRADRHDAAMVEIDLAKKAVVATTRPASARTSTAGNAVFGTISEPGLAIAQTLAFAGETDAA